ncbi:hypothetical protein BTE48_10820 [Oceanospirillum multiglobuliferum]|uniref:histidine kinase n=1 Tax=Oceanospirillum multiglobuliferum TaxID=64969 RepID=A0A1V4T3D7_9GAMM|nr:hypothetical protein BTE48_10820 [Oceanospirillum multiglobuliferum]
MVGIQGLTPLKRLHNGERYLVTRAELDGVGSVIIKQPVDSTLSTEAQRLLQHEYEILKSLDIAGIPRPIALQQTDEGLISLFQDDQSTSLNQLLKAQAISWQQGLAIAEQLSHLLGLLHQKRVIHKQITPSNILLNTETNKVVLIDFTQATLLESEQPRWHPPQFKLAELAYIAPEQTGRINRNVDYRTDFYTLGATLYELFTSQPPFCLQDPLALIHAHIAKLPRPLNQINPAIPEVVSNVVLKLLAKDASQRYQSSYGLSHDLKRCLVQLQQQSNIKTFTLAEADIAERFVLPQKLYGRQDTIQTLIQRYDQVAQGQQQILLISGYAGVGKSSLVHEVRQYITEKKGLFISGKFGQFDRNRPYAAIIQALQSLVRQLLTEPEANVKHCKTLILKALAGHAQVMTRLIPELELIIGRPPEAAKLSPAEEKNRFARLFQRLLGVFATHHRPLVLFLDDLQWADLSSLALIESFAQNKTGDDNSLAHLMLIGSYRDEEVRNNHPLRFTIDQLRQQSSTLCELQLQALNLAQVTQLLSDTLHTTENGCLDLATICLEKTQGNPFFLSQFLRTLQEDGLIYFNQDGWYWDLAAIQAQSLSADVIDLMISKIQRLKPATQQVLRLAACIGNIFSLRTLAIVNQQTPKESANDLWQALSEHLITPVNDNYRLIRQLDLQLLEQEDETTLIQYRFVHDRVQQAAYSLLSIHERQGLHLQIGELLQHHLSATERHQHIFEITNHLNQAQSGLQTPQQREALAELNLEAGERSRDSAAFGAAFDYFQNGLQMLNQGWQSRYALTLALTVNAAEAAYIQSEFTLMEQMIEQVKTNARSLLDQVRVYELQIQAQVSQNQFEAALQTSLQVLSLLGINLPEQPNKLKCWYSYLKTQWLIKPLSVQRSRKIADITDPYIKAALPIMASMFGVIKFSSSGLRPLVMAKQVELTLQYGLMPASAQAFAGYGGVLCGQYGRINQGYQLGLVALSVDQQQPSKLTHHKTLSLFNTYIRHWKEPLSATLAPLLQGYHAGLDCGDIEWAAYCLAAYIQYQLPLAHNLEEAQPRLDAFLKQISNTGQKQSEYYSRYALQTLDNLRGLNHNPLLLDGRYNQEAPMLALHIRNNHRTAVCIHHFYKALLSYLFGDYNRAERHNFACEKDLPSIGATYTSAWFQFIAAMTQLALLPNTSILQQPTRLHRVKGCLKQVQRWAQHCPKNHQHRVLLIQAESARVQKRYHKAMSLFEQAISAALDSEIVLEQALAYELTAQLYLDWQKPLIAESYLKIALQRYRNLGAHAKAEQLINQYQLRESKAEPLSLSEQHHHKTDQRHNNQSLDILSVIRASHAIADEIVLERLLSRLMTLALENAGGQRGILALQREGTLFIEAEADLHRSEHFITGLPIEGENQKLPVNIVHYVYRTKETVVLSNALEHEMFMHDSYIRLHQPKSLLCMPILYHGELTAVLYLENKESSDIFTRERLETLQILSAQAAISIENAKLYLSLQKSEQAFRSLFENAIEGIFRTNPEGVFLSVNPAFSQLLGYESAADFLAQVKMLSQGCFKYKPQQQQFMQSLVEQAQVRAFETTWLKADAQQVEVSLSARPVLDEQGQILYYEGSIADISERKNREKAEASSEAKSQFLATMSHEIRTPMNGILGMAQLLMRSSLNAEQQRQIKMLYQSGQSLLAILNDVLDFTKVETGQVELEQKPFSITEALHTVQGVIQPLTDEKALHFSVELPDNLPALILGDQRVLHQILLNLCANAVKFTHQGFISLRLFCQRHNDQTAYLRIEVEDSGIGIDKALHQRIFQQFSQADSSITRRYGGTGLGLAICKQLVELQGGQIGFSSDTGIGCLFWFELQYPIIDQAIASPERMLPILSQQSSKLPSLNILLVEDTEINQQVAAGLLESDGHQVNIAEDGYTALSLHHDNHYDLVLMDIHLPDMDGMETTRRMRQHHQTEKATVPIIALTAALTPKEVQQYQDAGINGILAKPLQFEQLQALLLSLAGHHPQSTAFTTAATDSLKIDALNSETEANQPQTALINHRLIQQHVSMLGAEKFTQLVQGFEQQFQQLQQNLDQAIQAQNWSQIIELAHRMSGSAANFGLENLSSCCKTIEQAEQNNTSVSELQALQLQVQQSYLQSVIELKPSEQIDERKKSPRL